MSILYLLNDYSTSMPWNFAAIHANKEILAVNGLELGPFFPFVPENIPTHTSFWSEIPKDKPIPAWLDTHVEKVLNTLDAGNNVLLLNLAMRMPGARSFARLLKSRNGFVKHTIKPIFVIGRPLCVFEQRWRWVGPIVPSDRIPHAKRVAGLYNLVEDAISNYGKNNITCIADLSDNPKSLCQPELTSKIFSIMGCEKNKPLDNIPLNPMVFGSLIGRRLYNAHEVRYNAWPSLDVDAYRSCIYDVDADLDNDPVSPLALRHFLQKEGRENQAMLENLLGLESGAFDAPQWLLDKKAVEIASPLASEKVRKFAMALPKTIALALNARLNNDANLLSSDQECLRLALANRSGDEFEHISEPGQPVELTVLTMTYNHEEYIAECMDSVQAQRTAFPVRHIVLDHCSTDATPKIVAEYANKYPSIRPVLLSQHVPNENVYGLLGRCTTKYAALCDGDDYFTHPEKLQRQVEFLESHPKSSLVFHPVKVVFEDCDQAPGYFPGPDMLPRGLKEEYYLADLFKGNFIQTNTVVYRWQFAEGLPAWFRPDLCPGDWYWHLLHAENGKIGFIPNVMSVYRRHANALYVNSFRNTKEHRRTMGIPELETYKAINEHFKGRYFRNLASLAYGVFFNFLEISLEEDDNTLLEAAYFNYPDFGAFFMEQMKKANAGNSKDNPET